MRVRDAARGGVALALAVSLGCAAKRVDVGGYKLGIRCAGSGSPTVVMDSGLGDTMESWGEVWPGVARFTRVCAYDRAGLGRSDPGPTPRTSQRIVAEMHALFTNAGLQGSYVLVGHSFGGLNVRLFAREHPEEVAGLVLVEATHEDYPARENALRSEAEKRRIANAFGLAPPAAKSEFLSLSQSVSELSGAPPPPDVPTIVITAGERDETASLRALWMELQKDLVRRAPHARQIIAEKSGHYVQFDQPSLVVEAIRVVVEQARAGGASAAGAVRPVGRRGRQSTLKGRVR